MSDWSITISRPSDDKYTLSYDVWGKRNAPPTAAGDGTFIGNYTIDADESSISLTWTAPTDGLYKFLYIPLRNDIMGREVQS